MRVTRRWLSLVLLVGAMLAGAGAGGARRVAQPAELAEVRTRVSSLTREGKVSEAVVEAEAFVQRHPDSADAHLLMTEALLQMAETTTNPERTTLLERTARHYERVVELTKDSTLRLYSLGQLVTLHYPRSLNRLDRAETYARRFITETPGEAVSYVYLVELLKSTRRVDDAAQALIEARKAVSKDAFQQAHLGDLMVDLADARHGASIDIRRRLLDQAQAIADEGLEANRGGVEGEALLQLKSQAASARVQLEPGPRQ